MLGGQGTGFALNQPAGLQLVHYIFASVALQKFQQLFTRDLTLALLLQILEQLLTCRRENASFDADLRHQPPLLQVPQFASDGGRAASRALLSQGVVQRARAHRLAMRIQALQNCVIQAIIVARCQIFHLSSHELLISDD